MHYTIFLLISKVEVSNEKRVVYISLHIIFLGTDHVLWRISDSPMIACSAMSMLRVEEKARETI